MSDVPVSPDITPYAPLAPYERSAVDVALTALADMATKLPGVTLREAMTEVVVVETLAAIVADLGVAVDRIPAVVFEAIVRLFDVDRDIGDYATVEVEFTVVDDTGHTVPAGTEVTVTTLDGVVIFTTDEDLVIGSGNTTGVVAATATTIGDAANGVEAGTAVRVRSGGLPHVAGAALDTTVTGGRDPESDDAYFTRAAQRFARLNDALVHADHFTAATLELVPGARVLSIDAYDGSGTPGAETGNVTVVVRPQGGGALSSGEKTDLKAALEEDALVNLVVTVVDATETAVDVEVEVVPAAGYTDSEAIMAVEEALAAHLDPETWPWSATVRFFDVVHLIEDLPQVAHIVAGSLLLDEDTADVSLAGDGPLAAAGTIEVTV